MHFRKMKVVFLFIHVLAVVMISVMTVHLCSMAVEKVPEECDIPVRVAALVVLWLVFSGLIYWLFRAFMKTDVM